MSLQLCKVSKSRVQMPIDAHLQNYVKLLKRTLGETWKTKLDLK